MECFGAFHDFAMYSLSLGINELLFQAFAGFYDLAALECRKAM
jgi:hypothetical protein